MRAFCEKLKQLGKGVEADGDSVLPLKRLVVFHKGWDEAKLGTLLDLLGVRPNVCVYQVSVGRSASLGPDVPVFSELAPFSRCQILAFQRKAPNPLASCLSLPKAHA